MHDGQLEERVRSGLRHEGEALSFTITSEELERRLVLRRRERFSRGLSTAAAGLAAVLVFGAVATSSGWFDAPSAGSGPTSGPTASPESFGAARDCESIDPRTADGLPMVVLDVDPGENSITYQGTPAEIQVGNRHATPLINWSGLDPISVGLGSRLEVSARNPDACFVRLDVTYADGDQVVEFDPPLAEPIAGPTRLVEVRPPPYAGDWLLRVRAEFATDPAGEAWSETVFRLVVAKPAPSGEATCEPVDPSSWPGPPEIGAGVSPGDTVRYSGVTSGYRWADRAFEEPEPWVDVPSELQIVVWPEVEQLVVDGILVADGVVTRNCLYEVQAEALLTNTSQASPSPVTLAVQRGVGTLAAEIEPPPVGAWLVKVRARFATTDGSPAWSETTFRVIVLFDGPALTVGPDFGEPIAEPGCPSYQLASGASAADQCGAPYAPMEGRDPIPVAPGAALAFRLTDGWLMDESRVVAVNAELVAANEIAPEHSVFFDDSAGATLTVPIRLDPGSWILRISLNGHRAEDSFGAYYDVAVTVTP